MTEITDAKIIEDKQKSNDAENGFATGLKLQLFQCEAGKVTSLLCSVTVWQGRRYMILFKKSLSLHPLPPICPLPPILFKA